MDFKITEQFARSVERFIAECNSADDATLFLQQKLAINEQERKQIIYRVYDENQELLQESNEGHLTVSQAKYAEGVAEFDDTSPLAFQIFLSVNSGEPSKTLIAQCNDKKDASLFISSKFEAEAEVLDNAVFFIIKNNMIVDTINKTKVARQSKNCEPASDKGSKSQLSPLSTRPTPPGAPDYWVKREEDE